MQIKVKKYLFFGLKREIDTFFRAAQEHGMIQFLSCKRETVGKKELERSHDWVKVEEALKKLSLYPKNDLTCSLSTTELVHKILHEEEEIEELLRKKQKVKKELAKVFWFGNFSSSQIRQIEESSNGCSFRFFTGKCEVEKQYPHLTVIHREKERVYLLGIDGAEESKKKNRISNSSPDSLREIFVSRSKNEWEEEIRHIEEEVKKKIDFITTSTSYLPSLHQAWIDHWENHHLTQAKEHIHPLLENHMFAIEGWAPANQEEQIRQWTKSFSINFTEVVVEEEDQIPSHLQNRGIACIGEDLVDIYDTPAMSDPDPSLWILFSFSLFFGIILSDAGYGMILLCITLILWKKFSYWRGIKKRFISLLAFLSSSSILWGLFIPSFFGIRISPHHFLMKFSLIHFLAQKKVAHFLHTKNALFQEITTRYPDLLSSSDPSQFLGYRLTDGQTEQFPIYARISDQVLLEISLFIGMLHLTCSLLRNLRRHPANLGWFFFLSGIYLYAPSILGVDSLLHILLPCTLEQCILFGKQCIWLGVSLALLLALIKERFKGILEPIQAITIFSDNLSYLRLYALAMSGAIMSATFNEVAAKTGGLLGLGILLIGHAVNFSLNIMGGVIHGLRLNFLEWYHHSFEGGGKVFRPLRKWKHHH